MLENMILYANLYIKNDKNMGDYVNCIKVFEKFCRLYSDCEITPQLFMFYFANWLPMVIGQNESWRSEDMLPAVMDFCHEYDSVSMCYTEDMLYDLPCSIENDLKRIMLLKSQLLKLCDGALISFQPYIINLSKLKKNYDNIVSKDKGYYKMTEVFTNNLVVLKKVSGYNFHVRVNMNSEIMRLLRKGDILRLNLVKTQGKKCWDVARVKGLFYSLRCGYRKHNIKGEHMKTIEELNKCMQNAVDQSEYAEKKLVFGNGDIKTKILLIGEAPGGDEEKQGKPFVGKAGKNLDEFIEIVGLNREDLYITNVVKLRPINISPKTGKPVNRTPNSKEIEFFLPFLKKEIELVSPDLVVTLGNVPLKAVSGDKKITIGDVHGTLIENLGFKLFPLYHPASIIYNRGLKDTYFEDLESIRNYL